MLDALHDKRGHEHAGCSFHYYLTFYFLNPFFCHLFSLQIIISHSGLFYYKCYFLTKTDFTLRSSSLFFVMCHQTIYHEGMPICPFSSCSARAFFNPFSHILKVVPSGVVGHCHEWKRFFSQSIVAIYRITL
jgi:hypothetical protein